MLITVVIIITFLILYTSKNKIGTESDCIIILYYKNNCNIYIINHSLYYKLK